nr:hypothetical protein [uncultured Sphingobacterium sp.]
MQAHSKTYSIIITIFLLFQSSAVISQDYKDEHILRDIVFMRTEGLVMTQLMEKHSKNKDILVLCKQIRNYYKNTQPILVDIIKGKTIDLDQNQFEQIWKAGEKSFLYYSDESESKWNKLFLEHINASVNAYTKLLRERQDDDIAYFTFRALPELVNLAKAYQALDIN